MSHTVENRADGKKQKPLEVLRQRRGGVPSALLQRQRRQAADRRRVIDALRSGAKTVPEVAQAAGLPAHEAFWHLMAMKKYGKLAEGPQRDDYFEYILAETSEPTEAAS